MRGSENRGDREMMWGTQTCLNLASEVRHDHSSFVYLKQAMKSSLLSKGRELDATEPQSLERLSEVLWWWWWWYGSLVVGFLFIWFEDFS